MKMDTTKVITDYRDKPVMWVNDDKSFAGKMTARSVVIDALNNSGEENPTVKKKLFDLSLKVQQEDSVSLDLGELALIKEKIDQRCSPMVLGRMYELLDPAEPQIESN